MNYSHWHIIVPELREKGISTALYPSRIKVYFDAAPIVRLIHQTPTRNVAVNRLLDKFVPVAETKYIDDPDGVALPGEFNLPWAQSIGPNLLAGQENSPLFARATVIPIGGRRFRRN